MWNLERSLLFQFRYHSEVDFVRKVFATEITGM